MLFNRVRDVVRRDRLAGSLQRSVLLVLVLLDRGELARPQRSVEPLADAPFLPRRDGYWAKGHGGCDEIEWVVKPIVQ